MPLRDDVRVIVRACENGGVGGGACQQPVHIGARVCIRLCASPYVRALDRGYDVFNETPIRPDQYIRPDGTSKGRAIQMKERASIDKIVSKQPIPPAVRRERHESCAAAVAPAAGEHTQPHH
jgi:hypothetical protein